MFGGWIHSWKERVPTFLLEHSCQGLGALNAGCAHQHRPPLFVVQLDLRHRCCPLACTISHTLPDQLAQHKRIRRHVQLSEAHMENPFHNITMFHVRAVGKRV